MAAPGIFDGYRRIRHCRGEDFDIFPTSQPIAASQTVKKYDILSLNSAGALQQSISLPSSNSSANTSGGNLAIAGVALCDFTTDGSANLTVPAQGVASGNYGCPPVAKISDIEMLMRIYDATATNTQQDDVVIGYSRYQFQRWRDTAATIWWYSLIITTTNGEMIVVERAQEVVGSALTDNYGLVWVRANALDAVRQV